MNNSFVTRRRGETLFCSALGLAIVGVGLALHPAPEVPPYNPRMGPTFVNWETPQVYPIDKTPDGTRLLVCNTADNRLEVFSLTGAAPVLIGEVPVGLDPVSVRARTNTEVWVVNHISDSISIVNLSTMNVVRSIRTGDEPCDIVFAGTPQRAFVSCAAINTVQVFDPANPAAAPSAIAIDAEQPRALAVSPDGATVYAAVFESGNRSTILGGGSTGDGTINFPPNAVSVAGGPYAGVNPPPNSGAAFSPAKAPANGTPPRVGQIVKKNNAGLWMDDNNRNWTALVSGASAAQSGRVVGWNLPDRDLAVINTSSLGVAYATTLMNLCMAIGVNPATGMVSVVGTDAINEVRFEPNINGKFIRVNLARVDPGALTKVVGDLNPHLTYTTTTIPQAQRDRAIGDPRAIVWNAAGTKGYVAGMGSNNVIVINAAGARAGLQETIPVAQGPTGLCLDEARGKLYVLSRFDASVSVIDLTSETVAQNIPFFDPSPTAIKVGRKHLYDTHKSSGLGQASCASCHVDARMDRLAWDLGDPSGAVVPLTERNLGSGQVGLTPATTTTPYQPYHPMKGPMTTQTFQDIIGHEPLHWRGDRDGLEDFNGAFVSLQGDDTVLTPQEMQEFEDFVATITFPPNPNRNFDNTLPTSMPLPGHFRTGRFGSAGAALPNGNAQNGLALYTGSTGRRLDQNVFTCVQCHTLPTGAGPDVTFASTQYLNIPVGAMGQHHLGLVSVDGSANIAIKVPQIRNMAQKSGFNTLKTSNNAGFGFLHDGSVDSIERFVSENAFTINNDQEVADLVAFIFCITGGDLPQGSMTNQAFPPGPPSQDTRTSVGWQTTLINGVAPESGQMTLIANMLAQADAGKVGVVVKGIYGGQPRGFTYIGSNTFQSDRQADTITAAQLAAAAAPGSELTYTVVVKGTETRIGIDRDLDGILDGEVPPCIGDFNQDGGVDGADVEAFFVVWESGEPAGDVNQDGGIDGGDVEFFFVRWEAGC